jgi:hypothetical protein
MIWASFAIVAAGDLELPMIEVFAARQVRA